MGWSVCHDDCYSKSVAEQGVCAYRHRMKSVKKSPESMQRALGRVIRRHRSEVGLSQEGFADLVGLHRTYIGSVERGERNVSFQNLLLLAQALNLSGSQLLAIAEKVVPLDD